MDKEQVIERVGGILGMAFGKDIAIGFLFGLLSPNPRLNNPGFTPDMCYQYINGNKPLFSDVTDEDWVRYGKMARRGGLADINIEFIAKEFQKRRPDLLSVVINTQGGPEWLQAQVEYVKSKMSLT